jgi:hypothetical protein
VTYQQVCLLRGRDPQISSHKFQGITQFGKTSVDWLLNFTSCLNRANILVCSFRIFSGQKNMHSHCEPESESLVGFTFEESLAIGIAGTLKGSFSSFSW